VMMKILKTGVVTGHREPGMISTDNGILDVGTGRDLLRITMIQPAGKKAMPSADFLRGHRGIEGKRFSKSEKP
jgi:methionyl-tRNA formyltransferase